MSLVVFLSKFKENLDFQRKNMDTKEVKIKRDSLDWSLSLIESSFPEIFKKILKAKEKFIEWEKEKKEIINTIQMKGGNK